MLMPRKTKYRKQMRGRMRGLAKGGSEMNFGDYGIQAMGKGKGNVEGWVAKVKPGRVMFELSGVSEDVAREAMRLAMHKLPMRTRFIVREDGE